MGARGVGGQTHSPNRTWPRTGLPCITLAPKRAGERSGGNIITLHLMRQDWKRSRQTTAPVPDPTTEALIIRASRQSCTDCDRLMK
jgi:hypothetical protein